MWAHTLCTLHLPKSRMDMWKVANAWAFPEGPGMCQPGQQVPDAEARCAQGSGKQQRGALVNLVAFYVFALPLSLALGFGARMGVVGLFLGMGAGPVVQSVLYAVVVGRMDWRSEAARAVVLAAKEEAAVLQHRVSDGGPILAQGLLPERCAPDGAGTAAAQQQEPVAAARGLLAEQGAPEEPAAALDVPLLAVVVTPPPGGAPGRHEQENHEP